MNDSMWDQFVAQALTEVMCERRARGELSRHWRVGFAREVATLALKLQDEWDGGKP